MLEDNLMEQFSFNRNVEEVVSTLQLWGGEKDRIPEKARVTWGHHWSQG